MSSDRHITTPDDQGRPHPSARPPLRVDGSFGGYAEVGHGNACVVLIATSPTNVPGSLIMTPDEARTLADSLRRQADHAESAACDPSSNDAPTEVRHD